jgi:hypothetical protein
MGKIINLGKFEINIPESIIDNSRMDEIDNQIKKMGSGWRVPKYFEIEYIFSLRSKFNILNIFKSDNLYVFGDHNNLACYVEGKKLHTLTIDDDEDSLNIYLDYILIKHI